MNKLTSPWPRGSLGIICLSVAAVLLTLTPKDGTCISPQGVEEIRRLSESAAKHEKDRNFPAAISDSTKAISLALATASREQNARELSSLYLLRGKCVQSLNPEARDSLDRALHDFSAAIELDPGNIEALVSRGWLFRSSQNYQRGIDDSQRALALDPKHVSALFCLGRCYQGLKDHGKAIRTYETLLEIQPDADVVLNELAWMLATLPDNLHRNGAKAVQYAERAVKLHDQNHAYLDTLAAAYAEARRFNEAVITQTQAIALEKLDAKSDRQNATEYKERLKLYRKNMPYRDVSEAL